MEAIFESLLRLMFDNMLISAIALLFALFIAIQVLQTAYRSGLATGLGARRRFSDQDVERATMTMLGKKFNPSPDIDWHAARDWKVSEWRAQMRKAVESINQGQQ